MSIESNHFFPNEDSQNRSGSSKNKIQMRINLYVALATRHQITALEMRAGHPEFVPQLMAAQRYKDLANELHAQLPQEESSAGE